MSIEKGDKKRAYEIGKLGGAPTKYRGPETLQMMASYLENYEENGDIIPSVAGLAIYLKVNKDTLYEWAKKHTEWKSAMNNLAAAQEQKLLSGGLSGTYNSTIAKLVLTKHGYSDKQEISGAEGKPLQVETWNLVGVKPKDGDTGTDS